MTTSPTTPTGAPADSEEVFDICDRRNVYEPCPQCGKDYGMGLTTKGQTLFVLCACGHAGPAVETPTPEQYDSWPVSWHQRDRQAFDAWNDASVAARPPQA